MRAFCLSVVECTVCDQLTWKDTYDPVAAAQPYMVPEAVYKVIGGSASGGATVKEPLGGWENTNLMSIFAHTVARTSAPTAFPKPTVSEGTNTASASMASGRITQSKTAPGIIAAGVVGGLLCVAIGGLLFVCLRRRRKNERPKDWHKPELPADTCHLPVEEKSTGSPILLPDSSLSGLPAIVPMELSSDLCFELPNKSVTEMQG